MSSIFKIYNSNIYLAHKNDFVIEVFDADGNKLYSIEQDYDKLNVTEEDKKGIHDHFKTDPRFRAYYERIKDRLSFPDYFPALRDFYLDNRKIYVRTYRKSGENTEFLVLDANQKGKLLETVFLPITDRDKKESYPFTIKNGTIYQLVDNEAGDWNLHINRDLL